MTSAVASGQQPTGRNQQPGPRPEELEFVEP